MSFVRNLCKRYFSSSSLAIKNVTIIGSGLMGSGIAQIAAQNGFKVTLIDLNNSLLENAKNSIRKNVERVSKKKFKDGKDEEANNFVSETIGRISFETDSAKGVSHADIVIEAVKEDLYLKQELFKIVDHSSPDHTILVSNTSSLPISRISEFVSKPENFGGLHFFNPVPVMKLVEVVRTDKTSDSTFNTLLAFSSALGKTAVKCKDTPGFIVNRLLVPYMAEAVRLMERGDASAEDIDISMKLGAGYPMGPFELADYVGLDTLKFIMDGWQADYPNNPLFKSVRTIDKLVAENKLGVKTGEGFYSYKKK